MHVARLSLTDFRSYPDALVSAGSRFVILTGDNGAGKTNLLEAVSLLVPGRGLRGASLSEMARRGGAGGFSVAAHCDGLDIGTGTAAGAPERRLVRINGAAAAANSLSEWLAILWLTPAMDRLFADTASSRRRFLDRLVLALHPDHAGQSARYEAAMRARNKLLSADEAADPEWLSALEARMADHGCRIAQNRTTTVAALAGRISNQPEDVFARADLALESESPLPPSVDGLAEVLRLNRKQDGAAGRTLAGPHRTDLAVTHRGKNQPASLCSTGEQKALLIGLILAHAELVTERTGRRPILLLDEIAAHLDPSRRSALFERLSQAGGQVWMTGTEASPFASIEAEASRFEVSEGSIRNR